MTQQQIISATAQKHIKIFLLSELNIKRSEIARLLGTNQGHVGNVLKEYREKPAKAEKAKEWAAGYPFNGKPMPHPETEDSQLI